MPLRGKLPNQVQKRLKAFFYGAAGVGKTYACLGFPAPYMIDTERGAENSQYIELLEKNNGALFQTSDFDEVVAEVKTLLSVPHPYKTVIIDPLTLIYHDLVDKAEQMLLSKSPTKNESNYGKHYVEANKKIRQLNNLLLRLDMNVIITAHAKNEYGDKMTVLGQTFDCYKKMDHIFDLLLRIEKRTDGRKAIVQKTRIDEFKPDEIFPFSFEEIAKRYPLEALIKESSYQKLATSEQIQKISHLIGILKIPAETTDKWLSKANSSSWDEMTEEQIQKCIDALEKKVSQQITKGDIDQ